MAGTTQKIKRIWSKTLDSIRSGAVTLDALFAFYTDINAIVVDLEMLRSGAGKRSVIYQHEELAAGADIAARGIFVAPVAMTVLDSVTYTPGGNSAGIDGSNTLVLTLRNITEGVDVATVTRTTNVTANTPVSLTLTAANADIAASDVLGIVVTQGAAADVTIGTFQFNITNQTVDASTDLTAFALDDSL